MKPIELVKKTKLDRITGTRTVTRCEGTEFVELSESEKRDLEIVDNLTGKTLYQIEHGASPVMDLFEDENNSQVISEDNGLTVRAIDVEDFMLYQVVDSGKPGIFRWWNTNVYIDAKRVDLPFLNTPTLGKDQRIYIAMTEGFDLYKFPKLLYPTPIKDFFKWLKRKKKISINVKTVLDRNEKIDNIRPKRNIKEESEIQGFIKDLEEVDNNSKYRWHKNYILRLKTMKDIVITQNDINDYITEAGNRYKIYR